MTDPTLSEMADEVGVCASMVANVRANMVLHAAERTLRRVDYAIRKNDGLEPGDKWTGYEAFQHVRDVFPLRAMQAQEQGSRSSETRGPALAAGSAIGEQSLSKRESAGLTVPADCTHSADPPPPEDSRRKGTTPLIVGKTYDPATASRIPPPPEDALLARVDACLEPCDKPHEPGSLADLVQQLRDRIAADAETIIDLAKLARQIGSRPCNEDHLELKEKLAAAEARAQRAEADTKRLDVLEMSIRDGSYDSIWNDIIGVCEHAYMTIGPGPALRAAIDAALARPEPSGKEKG